MNPLIGGLVAVATVTPLAGMCSGPTPRPVHHMYASASVHEKTADGYGCVPNPDDVEVQDGDVLPTGAYLRVDPPAEFGDVEDVHWSVTGGVLRETCLYGAAVYLAPGQTHTVTAYVDAWSGDSEVTTRTVTS